MKRTLLNICFVFLVLLTKAQSTYFPPLSFNSTWDTVSPKSLGWCLPQIDSLYQFLEKENSKAFIVLKDGKIVLEKYFGSFTKDSIWYWASAGKTITSFLIGKAQEESYLKISDTSSKYLGKGWTNCTASQEDKITIQNQLTMTTGLDDGVTDNHCTDKACLVFKANAGQRWAYHNAPYTLLEKVIENATGKEINNYTSTKLSSKTGINGIWLTSDFNNVFYSKPRNMARFGLLYQNNCVWNADTLLRDMNYINQSINTSQNFNLSYGYLWWLNGKSSIMVPSLQTVFPGSISSAAPADMFAGLGKNGQIVSVSKSKGLVVVRMGELPANFGEVPILFCDQIWQKLNAVMCNTNSITEQNFNPNKIVIYPNPATNQLFIEGLPTKNYAIECYDLFGKLFFTSINENSINPENLPSGVYTLKIKFGQAEVIKRFVKQ